MNNELKNYAVILASGNGTRFGGELPKQFAQIAGKTVLEHSIEIFEKCQKIDNIIIVINSDFLDLAQKIVDNNNYKKCTIIKGGQTRKESSNFGISAIKEEEANVIIHDCARPLLSEKILINCINSLKEHNAVAVGIPTTDTIWEINDNGYIKNIPNRKHYKIAQTPQCFKLSLIKKAHQISTNQEDYTDDCSLIIKNKLGNIFIIDGDTNNIKITYPKDIYFAEYILSDNV